MRNEEIDGLELSKAQRLFVGFKLDGSLRHQLQALSGPDQKYVSNDDAGFLRLCRVGEKHYVGKVVEPPLGTERVDDVRRNVLSIVGRLCPDIRLPTNLEIWICDPGSLFDRGLD